MIKATTVLVTVILCYVHCTVRIVDIRYNIKNISNYYDLISYIKLEWKSYYYDHHQRIASITFQNIWIYSNKAFVNELSILVNYDI